MDKPDEGGQPDRPERKPEELPEVEITDPKKPEPTRTPPPNPPPPPHHSVPGKPAA